MAGIDKRNEFYTNASRFAFLASAYRPDALPKEVNEAMDILVNYFYNDVEFKIRTEEAEEYFEAMLDQLQMSRRKDLLCQIIKECSR